MQNNNEFEEYNKTIPSTSFNMDGKNILIILLFVLLFFTLLGVNILQIIVNLFQVIVNFVQVIIGMILYFLGTFMNYIADVMGYTASSGLDIAEGTVHSVGNILRNESNSKISIADRPELTFSTVLNSIASIFDSIGKTIRSLGENTNIPMMKEEEEEDITITTELDEVLNTDSTQSPTLPVDDTISNTIQNSISSSKTSWCLSGEYNGSRSCVEINAVDKCMSGQIYPSQSDCVNIKVPKKEQVIKKMTSSSVKMVPSQNTNSMMVSPQNRNPIMVPPLNQVMGPPNYFYQQSSRG